MLSATLTLDDASGDESSYVLVKNNGDGTQRLDSATTLSEPRMLIIKHSTNGSGSSAIDRHLVQFSQTEETAGGLAKTATVNFTMAVPRDSVITNQIVYDLVSNLIDFISDGGFTSSGIAGTTNLAALLRGES